MQDRIGFDRARSAVKTYHKGETVFAQGVEVGRFYRVRAGWARVVVMDLEGRRHVPAFMTTGAPFGFLGVSPFAVEAVSELTVASYRADTVAEFIRSDPAVGMRLLAQSEQLQRDLIEHFYGARGTHVADRVLRFLQRMSHICERGPHGTFVLPMSRRDISDHLGVAPETLSRILQQLRTQGDISGRGRQLSLGRGPGAVCGPGGRPQDAGRRAEIR